GEDAEARAPGGHPGRAPPPVHAGHPPHGGVDRDRPGRLDPRRRGPAAASGGLGVSGADGLHPVLAAAADHPDVDDAAVLERAPVHGALEAVAYLVSARPDADALGRELAARAGRADDGVAAVTVTALPLDASGALDAAALERIPV